MTAKEKLQPFFDVLDSEVVRIFAKRLSANDTGASGAHQAGIYLSNPVAFDLCPRLARGGLNPDAVFESYVMSHDVIRENRLTWYNQGTRDECRITRWAEKHKKNSVLQQNMTGALVVLLFRVVDGEIAYVWVWFCSDPEEEDLMEERIGVIEPGAILYDGHADPRFAKLRSVAGDPCAHVVSTIPSDWFVRFPDGKEIVSSTFALLATENTDSDFRLIQRRACEYRLFIEVEKQHVLPRIERGFSSVEEFIEFANSITNRRKSRSGKSFELHLERIFEEDGLAHTRGGRAEGKKTPDFIFPSKDYYHNADWPAERLRMLGVKTTCKDRWRQILTEADRIPIKHLITLQEGVSVDQFNEMKKADVVLVAPKSLHDKYPREIRASLVTLDQFIADTKSACAI